MGRALTALLVLLLLGGTGLTFWRCEGDPPAIEVEPALALGRVERALAIAVSEEGSGLREVRVVLAGEEGAERVVYERGFAGSIVAGGEPPERVQQFEVPLDARALGLAEGAATLEVVARDWSWASWLGGNETRVPVALTVDLKPPRVGVETGLSYVKRAGTGAVTYTVGSDVVRHGVQVADRFYPGHAHPSGGSRAFALYAVDRDAPKRPEIRVVAEDAAANRTEVGWPVQFQERKFEEARLNLSDGFLNGKVRSLAVEVDVDEEDPLRAFQKINRDVRALNEARIAETVSDTVGEALFEGTFVQMKNSQVTSRFAEHRTYLRNGEEVSEAIHYGYDLASVAGAPITASNAGRVIFADELGIYGNCVILDHGYGLSSLYAHLSQIEAAPGEVVKKNQVLGRSGKTGLAGGDHLHFAILVDGTYVEPREWWDPKWVREKVLVNFPEDGS